MALEDDILGAEDIAKLFDVLEEDVDALFDIGGRFALVPRKRSSDGELLVYKKDLYAFLEKRHQERKEYRESSFYHWDKLFEEDGIFLLP